MHFLVIDSLRASLVALFFYLDRVLIDGLVCLVGEGILFCGGQFGGFYIGAIICLYAAVVL